jgi:putative membrane protein
MVGAWWSEWSSSPPTLVILTLLLSAGVLYWVAARRRSAALRRRASWSGQRARAAAFYLGLAAIVVALDSPVDWFAHRLFWMHMVQHILLMMVAAPLIVIGAPWLVPLRLLPVRMRGQAARSVRRGGWAAPLRASIRWFGVPIAAWLAFNANLWVWHLPALYNLTLRNQAVHDVEHLLFLVLGIAFWAQVIDSPPLHSRLSRLWRVGYVTAAAASSWLLAVVLAYAPNALYSGYVALASRPGGISATTDQQLGAGMMWGPGSIPFAIAIFVGLYRWLGAEERQPSGNGHEVANGNALIPHRAGSRS